MISFVICTSVLDLNKIFIPLMVVEVSWFSLNVDNFRGVVLDFLTGDKTTFIADLGCVVYVCKVYFIRYVKIKKYKSF